MQKSNTKNAVIIEALNEDEDVSDKGDEIRYYIKVYGSMAILIRKNCGKQ